MYDELVKRLHRYTENCVAYKLDADFASAVQEAADAIEDLIAALTASNEVIAKNKPRWIPVTERLPEEKDRYLTVSIEPWFGTTVVDTMRWSGVWMYDGRQTKATVTHWMPLPEPPKEE